MGSFDSMGQPEIKKIKNLGARFEQLRKQLSDFRTLTNKKYLTELLNELDLIRSELIRMDGANLLDDGTLVIRTEFLVPFLNPSAPDQVARNPQILDLTDPEFIRKVVLNCSMDQWIFFSKRLPEGSERDQFLKACVRELKKQMGGGDHPL